MTKKTVGVIGICGANGNLIARILNERGYEVIGTDLSSEEKCRFSKSLDGSFGSRPLFQKSPPCAQKYPSQKSPLLRQALFTRIPPFDIMARIPKKEILSYDL